MAFGTLLGTLQVNAGSISNPFNATGSVDVAVGDLIIAVIGEQTGISSTGVTDNLGNGYTAQNAGTDAGSATGRCFYSVVTVAGTLTQVSLACNASTRDAVFIVAAIEGPVAAIDKNISNITTDVTSPFACPSSGVLTVANEIVIGWGTANYGTAWSATSPNLLAKDLANASNIKAAIGYQAVAATTAVAPAFTAASNPTQTVLSTLTFSKGAAQIAATLGGVGGLTCNVVMGPTAWQGSAEFDGVGGLTCDVVEGAHAQQGASTQSGIGALTATAKSILAALNLPAQYNVAGSGNVATLGTNASRRVSQSFIAGNTYIDGFIPTLALLGSPSDAIRCEIFASDGAGMPTGSAIVAADATLSAASINSYPSTTQPRFAFDNSGKNYLTPGTRYCLVLSRTGALE